MEWFAIANHITEKLVACSQTAVFFCVGWENGSIIFFYYLLYQLGTGGYTQKAQPVRDVYPKLINHDLINEARQ